MGTITVNVEDVVEQQFRKRVREHYGVSKGVLGRALTEAMEEWSRKKRSFERCMELLEHGVDMGKMRFVSRDEIHERN